MAIRSSHYSVLYDACVLYPAPLRDILIELASMGLFRAKWSERIHDEWIRNLLANRTDLTDAQLRKTASLMDKAVMDAMVTGYEPLEVGLSLPDPDDVHVLAAAIKSGCSAIITANLKDFPAANLDPFGIEAQHPDDFIHHQFDLHEPSVILAARACRARLRKPPITAKEYLDILLAQSLSQTVARLREYDSII